jgi:hypothetical protein
MATRWIAERPGDWVALGGRKMLSLWTKDTEGFWGLAHSYPNRQQLWSGLQWTNQAFYMLMLGLAGICFAVGLAGLVRGRSDHAPLLLFACTPIFVTLLAFGFTGQTRYHYPAMPLVLVAAGWTLAAGVRRFRLEVPASAGAFPSTSPSWG